MGIHERGARARAERCRACGRVARHSFGRDRAMCGLAGLLHLTGGIEPDRAALRRMTDAMAHRGPDGEGFFVEPGVGTRPSAARDHRPGRRRPADVQRGRLGRDRLQRRDLQPLRAAPGAGGARPPLRARAATPRRSSMPGRRGGRPASSASWACSPSRSGTAIASACSWRATGWARSRCTTRHCRTGASRSPPSWAALATLPELPRRIDPAAVDDFFAYGYVPEPATICAGRPQAAGGAQPADRARRVRSPAPRRYWRVPPDRAADRGGRGRASARRAACASRRSAADLRRAARRLPLRRRRFQRAWSRSRPGCATGRSTPSRSASSAPTTTRRSPSRWPARYRHRASRGARRRSITSPPAASRRAIYGEPFGDHSSVPTLRVCELARRARDGGAVGRRRRRGVCRLPPLPLAPLAEAARRALPARRARRRCWRRSRQPIRSSTARRAGCGPSTR